MTTTRPRYRERQVLRAEDLNDEQRYHVAMRRRHNIAHHDWGIVWGLAIDPGTRRVQPGMAIDGYGRELILPEPAVAPDDFDRLGADKLAVWLVYGRSAVHAVQRGRYDCGPGHEDRWLETAHVMTTKAGSATFNPFPPPGVPTDARDYGPQGSPPDDPAQVWPVFLGRLTRSGSPGTFHYAIDLAEKRPYVTLRGERVESPAGDAVIQVGSELAVDARRFAVSVRDATGGLVDRLAVYRDRRIVLQGNAGLGNRQDVSFAADARGHAHGLEFASPVAAPQNATPWEMRRAKVAMGGQPADELQAELFHPGDQGDPSLYRLALGHVNPAGSFVDCVSVRADGNVVIRGDLDVKGRIVQGPIPADPDDPRFQDALRDRWATGLKTGARSIDPYLHRSLAVTAKLGAIRLGKEAEYTLAITNQGLAKAVDVAVHSAIDTPESPLDPNPFLVARAGSIGKTDTASFSGTITIEPDGQQYRVTVKTDIPDAEPVVFTLAALPTRWSILATGFAPPDKFVYGHIWLTLVIEAPSPPDEGNDASGRRQDDDE